VATWGSAVPISWLLTLLLREDRYGKNRPPGAALTEVKAVRLRLVSLRNMRPLPVANLAQLLA